MSIIIGDDPATPTVQRRVATQAPLLTLSGLDFMMSDPDPVAGYRIRALRQDFTFGDPDEVITSIVSQLQDGDLEQVTRAGNRVATVPLLIDAPGSLAPGSAIALGQAAVDAACTFDGWTEMQWRSLLAGSETSVFEVTSATVSTPLNDVTERYSGGRYVTITIHARPFVRPLTPVTIDAPPVLGSTTTTIDDGSSVTPWSLLSVTPPDAHNLLTNPSFETNTTGWASSSGTSSIARAAVNEGFGSYVLKAIALSPPTVSYVSYTPKVTVTPGTSYRLGFLADPSLMSGSTARVLYRWWNSANTQVGGDHIANLNAGFSTVVITAPAGAVGLTFYAGMAGGDAAGGKTWYIDAAMLSDQPSMTGYFDGSTTSTEAITYSWTGTGNASTTLAHWTPATLAVSSGTIRATAYGTAPSIRRTGAIDMSAQNYLRIQGTARATNNSTQSGLQVTVADNGGSPITPISYIYNQTTGAFDIIIERPAGFTALDVSLTSPNIGTTAYGFYVAVDSVVITDNPFATGKVQSRQVQIYGSQRTELSLEVLALDAAGTTPLGLGEQVLIHTSAARTDGRSKFLSVRTASGATGTSDATTTGGYYTDLPTTAAPAKFTFPASTLLPGNYLPVARLRHSAAISNVPLSFRADVTTSDLNYTAHDPVTGWKTVPITVAAGAAWPQIPVSTWAMIPLGLLRLPPAAIDDADATITIEIGCDSAAIDLDDIFLCNVDVGEASLLLTPTASAVRLDAATVDAPQASAWVGAANGPMIADPSLWFGEQHQAEPGLLQIATVTPGCTTSRVSGHYYPRNHTNIVRVDQTAAAS